MLHRFFSKLGTILFVVCVGFILIIYGMWAATARQFPYGMLMNAIEAAGTLIPHWTYSSTDKTKRLQVINKDKLQPGLTKIVRVAKDKRLAVDIITAEGDCVQRWDIDWFELWGDATHVPLSDMPKARPGSHVHGAVIADDGGLVFNFEHLGLMKLDACGKVVWRLPYRTHHSIFIDSAQQYWVPGQINHVKPIAGLPNYRPPFIEPTLIKVSSDGQLLEEISVFDLLKRNQLHGLLYLGGRANVSTTVKPEIPFTLDQEGDTLHLNDIEVYSGKAGFFVPGDVMISLRNVNSVLVFDSTWKIKYIWANQFVRQHDPDFIDGNTISVYDNNNVVPIRQEEGYYSRVLIHRINQENMMPGSTEVAFAGNDGTPFFSHIMGKHQWLANGNLLVNSPMEGSVFEVTPQGEIVWYYVNIVSEGIKGIVESAERLPEKYNDDFFRRARLSCK